MRRLVVALAGATLVGALAVSPAAADHSWNGYHWARTAQEVPLNVGDNVNSTWDGALDAAISDWNRSSVLALSEVAGRSRGKCRPTSGAIEVCNDRYGNNGWLGIAQIWISGGAHITQATTRVNDTYFDTPTYNSEVKRRHVMCQEVGHDFGLGHQDESGADLNTCMDYASALDNPSPNQHDYAQLEAIYSHFDGAAATTGTLAETDVAPDRTERSDRISDSTITEHFGDGSKRITHVFWALERHHHPHDH